MPLVVTKRFLLLLAACQLRKQRGALRCIAIGRYKTVSPPIGCVSIMKAAGCALMHRHWSLQNCFFSYWLRVNYESSGVRSDASPLVVTKLLLLLLAACQLRKQRGAL